MGGSREMGSIDQCTVAAWGLAGSIQLFITSAGAGCLLQHSSLPDALTICFTKGEMSKTNVIEGIYLSGKKAGF